MYSQVSRVSPRHNLEWLYRLMQDPKRLFKRYLTTNIKYLWWTWKQ